MYRIKIGYNGSPNKSISNKIQIYPNMVIGLVKERFIHLKCIWEANFDCSSIIFWSHFTTHNTLK